MSRLRVLIVDPNPSVRDGLRAVLDGEPEIAVVGELAAIAPALAAAGRLEPDVVLVDLGLVEADGSDPIRGLLDRSPGSRVVVLWALEDEATVGRARAAGAHADVRKDAFREELLAAVRRAAGVSPGERQDDVDLTGREAEILRLVARGRSDREIAAVLAISELAVRDDLRRLCRAMGVADRAEAAIVAVERGRLRL
jgi:DNA-binding NarL/FixJ family response regulator